MIEIRHSNMYDTEDTRVAYNQTYQGDGILLQDSFYLWLLNLLKPRPGQVLLDVSCGQGRLVKFAQKKGLLAMGMDFAEEAVYKGQVDSPQSGWAVADGECLPLRDACVDYVTHIGSLEHYQNPEAGMSEIARVLKPSGVACVLVPNSYGLIGNIQHVWQTGHVFDDGQPLQRYNTRGGWQDMLAANGLKTFRIHKYERVWPRTWADLGWYLTRPTKIARLLMAWFVPINLANCLVYLCQRY
jgi:SAM-dependent methyltransferase